MRRYVLGVWLSLVAVCAFGQANGKPQLHFIDPGSGLGALLISSRAETMLVDDGLHNRHDNPLSCLRKFGVTMINHHTSYNRDLIACATQVFAEFQSAYDSGHSCNGVIYQPYVHAVGSLRKTASDANINSANPVEVTTPPTVKTLHNGCPR